MIVFIDLSFYEIPGARFAFWDTVSNEFVQLLHNQAWSTWDEFYHDFQCEYSPVLWVKAERFKLLCPNWAFEEDGRLH